MLAWSPQDHLPATFTSVGRDAGPHIRPRFGESRPSRDLVVSPGHAIRVDMLGEVLIPAGALVNGSTNRQIDVDAVTYWHVELDSHDVILAENLPAENYLEMRIVASFFEGDIVDIAAGQMPGLRSSSMPTSAAPSSTAVPSSTRCVRS